jgi:hypothetical protein
MDGCALAHSLVPAAEAEPGRRLRPLSHRLDTGLFILVSSLLRTQIGRPLWRSLHYLVFPCAALLFLHSILTDPNLKDGHPDLLDGGKVFVEIASLISLTATTIRIRLRGKGFRCK